MTTEEKANAYDMALEAARKELGVDRKEWKVVQHVLHNIFPELRESESEDERIRKALINILNEYKTLLVNESISSEQAIAYLEKQKERKPAEWSEEDEIMLGSLINYFEGDDLDCTADDVVAWLKSLRSQPHWKPSEEQMYALESEIKYCYACGMHERGRELQSLCEHLKKL